MSVAPTAIVATIPTLRPPGPFPEVLGPVGPDGEVVKGGTDSSVAFDPVSDVASGRTGSDDDGVGADVVCRIAVPRRVVSIGQSVARQEHADIYRSLPAPHASIACVG